MKIAELIKLLQTLPATADVFIEGFHYGEDGLCQVAIQTNFGPDNGGLNDFIVLHEESATVRS